MRKKLTFAIKIAVSATLLVLALRKLDFMDLWKHLHHIEIWWLVAAIAILIVQLCLATARWQVINCATANTASFVRLFQFMWVGTFFNQTLPSTIGGDAMRIMLLARDGESWSNSIYSVLVDRIIGVFALAITVAAALPWAFELIADAEARLLLVLIGFGVFGGFAAFVSLRCANQSPLMRWKPVRHLTQMAILTGKILLVPHKTLKLLVLSLFINFLTILAAWSLAKTAGSQFQFVQALVLIPPVLLITTLPISIAGWGVRETAMALAFSYVGLPQSDGVVISLLFGVSLAFLGVIGGIVWLAMPELKSNNG